LKRTRRQTVIRVFEIAGAFLVGVDALLYFGVYRPVQAMVSAQQQEFAASRRRILDGEVRIEQLKTFLQALPEAGDKLVSFEKEHAPPRRQGFSQAAKLVHLMTEQSGTELVSVGYKLDNSSSGPLQRLGVVINVAGPFPALLKFSHALETTSDFIVLRSFNIIPGEGGALALRLGADLYLTP
jgi:hypothetical protein